MTHFKIKPSAFTLISLFFLSLSVGVFQTSGAEDGPRVLLLNSNTGVGKYKAVQESFTETLANPLLEVDMGLGEPMIGKLRGFDPDLIYCIGAKAYSYAIRNFPREDIVFSSIINWLRLPVSGKTYGISNELPVRMPLMMYRYIFPEIKTIGILYSRQYTEEWFEKTRAQAEELGITVIGEQVSKKNGTIAALDELSPKVEALWLIPDPLVMPEKESLYRILETSDARQLPVFSYHDAFALFGAVLIVSVDDPTIGRQAAGIAMDLFSGKALEDRVQFPAGSSITLNMKKIDAYGLEYNKNALSAVNNIIK